MNHLAELNDFTNSPDAATVTEYDDSPRSRRDGIAPREGLPVGFRMRADTHYVDALDGPPLSTPLQMLPLAALLPVADDLPALQPAFIDSIRRFGILQPLIVQRGDRTYRVIAGRRRLAAASAAGLREVPCLVHAIDDEAARALAAASNTPSHVVVEARTTLLASADSDLAHALAALSACMPLLGDAAPSLGLTREVSVELARAELSRATCLLAATRIARYGLPPAPRRVVAAQELVARLADTLSGHTRLRGVEVDVVPAPLDAAARVDDQLLGTTLAAAAFTMCESHHGVKPSRLTLGASTEVAGRVTIALTRESSIGLTPPRATPCDATTEPAGSYALPLLALRQVAEAHGGTVTFNCLPWTTRLTVDLPLAARRL